MDDLSYILEPLNSKDSLARNGVEKEKNKANLFLENLNLVFVFFTKKMTKLLLDYILLNLVIDKSSLAFLQLKMKGVKALCLK